MRIDDEDIIFIATILALPLVAFIYRLTSEIMYVAIAFLIYYWIVSSVLPSHLEARANSIYRKAQVLCWMKLAGRERFTPQEQEILDRAVGGEETRKVVSEPKTPLQKHWKKAFLAVILIVTILPFAQDYTVFWKPTNILPLNKIEITDVFLNEYPDPSLIDLNVSERQTLYLTVLLDLKEGVFCSAIYVFNERNETLGARQIGEYFSTFDQAFSTKIFLNQALMPQSFIMIEVCFTDFTVTKDVTLP